MSSLIPFQSPAMGPSERVSARETPESGTSAQIVDVASHAGRARQVSSRRRPRRDWDPAFHVNLLTF
ncbi:MAG: hypothetical protein JHD16_04280 [Solirubrobacteraceae bacterium]|nr:hypothetical protein [Solirubrobacteraceae bacterium]